MTFRANSTTYMAAVNPSLTESSALRMSCWPEKSAWSPDTVMWAKVALNPSGLSVDEYSSLKSIPSTLCKPLWKAMKSPRWRKRARKDK